MLVYYKVLVPKRSMSSPSAAGGYSAIKTFAMFILLPGFIIILNLFLP